MAEQHRRGYEEEFRQRGRGWSDRDDWRWRDDERRIGGYREGHGQFGSYSRGSDQRYGGGDWRTRGEWASRPDERDSDAPFWNPPGRGSMDGGRRYEGRSSGGPWFTGGYGSGAGLREGYSGRGPKDYKRSDERIREDVSDRLLEDSYVDASDITVEVQDGEVTLSGAVNSRDQKRRAEDCVETVSGVREVHNRLRVNRQDGSSMSTSLLGLGGQSAKDSPDR